MLIKSLQVLTLWNTVLFWYIYKPVDKIDTVQSMLLVGLGFQLGNTHLLLKGKPIKHKEQDSQISVPDNRWVSGQKTQESWQPDPPK